MPLPSSIFELPFFFYPFMKQSKGITVLAKGVASCPTQAAAYGQCITANYKDAHKDMCQKEFLAFKQCVQQAVSIHP